MDTAPKDVVMLILLREIIAKAAYLFLIRTAFGIIEACALILRLVSFQIFGKEFSNKLLSSNPGLTRKS